MKVTVLVENRGSKERRSLRSEHGLSLHVQTEDKSILFDTGASDAFAHNARQLGIDLEHVDLAVLSHHHFDHGGGLPTFFETNPHAPVHLAHKDAGDCYFKAFGLINRYIGLAPGLFSKWGERFEFVSGFKEISPDVFILADISTRYPLPKGNQYLVVKDDNGYHLDGFGHELVMAIREGGGLVVFTACSHRGILNMVDAVARQFDGVPIKAVFGGFHLIGLPFFNTMAASSSEVEAIGEQMLSYSVNMVYTGHCTGEKAYRVLKRTMGDKLAYLPTGSQVEL